MDDRRQDKAQDKQFSEEVVKIDRVARVVKGGRRFRFRALVVIGDKKGKVGVGVSKGSDVQTAIAKAVDDAKKNLITVAFQEETIPHETSGRVSGAHVLLKPAASGTGIIAGGVVRNVVELSGIQNILSKSLGSSNKINCAYATIEALQDLKLPQDWITNRKTKAASAKS